MWKIYKNGSESEIRCEIRKIEYQGMFMGESYVSVNIESPVHIDFVIGDYFTYRGEIFKLKNIPEETKVSSSNSYNKAFQYNSVKFCGTTDDLTEVEFLDYVINDNKLHFTSLPEFSFYCATIQALADRIQANLDRVFTGNSKWTVICNASNVSISNRVIQASNIKVWDALGFVSSVFKSKFIVRGRTITIGNSGNVIPHIFKYGKGNGATQIKRNTDISQEVITRLHAYGNTTNLPSLYYSTIGAKVNVTITELSIADNTSSVTVSFHTSLPYSASYLSSPVIINIGGVDMTCTIDGVDKYYNTSQTSDDAKAALRALNTGDSVTYISGVKISAVPSQYKTCTSDLPNNMAVMNLMLPAFPNKSLQEYWDSIQGNLTDAQKERYAGFTFSTNQYEPYINAPTLSTIGIKENSHFFNSDDEDNEDIYPSMKYVTATSLRSAGHTIDLDSGDNGNLDEIASDSTETDGSAISGNGVYAQGSKIPQFIIYLKDIGFNFNDVYTGSPFKINMQNGLCGGREFECTSFSKVGNKWKLTCNRTEDIGLYFPYSDYNIKAGDKFVITGINMPKTYVDAASFELLIRSLEFVLKNDYTRYTYSPVPDAIKINELDEKEGTNIHDTIKEGDLLTVQDDDLGISDSIIIDTLKITEGDSLLPKYEITLNNNEKTQTALQKTQSKISSMTSGDGIGGYTLQQITDLVNLKAGDKFLSKTKEDTAQELITFLKGTKFGTFSDGLLGKGGYIDGDGNATLRKITAWEGLFTTVLSFNQVDVIQGQLLISDCRGVIDSVDTERQIITERFSNEESYSSVHVGDILRGVYNNLAETKWQDKATADYTDSCGFDSKVGYFTSYFTPVEILESSKGICRFRYAIKDGSLHPCPDMRFAAYGSFTEKSRQGCTLVTESTMIIYRNVNTWSVSDDVNLAKIEGKLDGHSRTSLDGTLFQLTGWGSYQNGNAYIDGANIQLNSIQGLSDEIKNNSGYQITVQSETRQLKVDDQGNVINGIKKTVNGATIYNVQASLLVAKGTDYLTLFGFDSTADTTLSGHYTIDVQPHGCSCILQNGNVIVTAIDGLQDGDSSTVNFDYDKMRGINEISIDVLINCEGNIVLTKTFRVPVIHTEVPFISSDLSNEMDSFGYNKISLAKVGLPISTAISLYKGIDKVSADTISLDLTGYTNSYDSSTHAGALKDSGGNTVLSYTLGYSAALTGEINITDISPDLASKLAIGINATVTYAGVVYERRCVLTINRIDSDVVYNVLPSVSQIVGRYNTSKVLVNSPTSVSCSVLAKTTSGVTTLSDLTGKCVLKYIIDSGLEQVYSSEVSVSSALRGIKFNLYDTVGNLIDTEYVRIVNDGAQGENAVTYKIAVYTATIKISKTGSVTPSTISCAVSKFDGSTVTRLYWDSLPSGLALWYNVDGGGDELYGGPFYTSGITTNVNLILRKDGNIIDTVTIPAVKDGSDGTQGKTGPFLYPAGIYSSSKYYTRTDTAIPFVLYNGSYWALDGSYYKTGGEGYVTGSTPSSSSQYWVQFNMLEYVFTKVLMADYGQLASAIFNDDFMISQQGVDSNGNASSDYTNFNSDSGSFIPNIMINFLTGAIKSRLTYTPLTSITYSNSRHTLNPNVDGNHIDVTTFSSGNILALPSPSAWKGLTLYFFFAIPYTRVASYQPTLSGSMVVDGYIVSTYSFTTNTAEFYSDGMYWYKMK